MQPVNIYSVRSLHSVGWPKSTLMSNLAVMIMGTELEISGRDCPRAARGGIPALGASSSLSLNRGQVSIDGY